MKNRIYIILLCIVLTTSILIGCGSKQTHTVTEDSSTAAILQTETAESQTVESTSEISEESSKETQTEEISSGSIEAEQIEEVNLFLAILSAEDGNAYKACNIMQDEYTLSISDSLSAEEQELIHPGSIVYITGIEEELKHSTVINVSAVAIPPETPETEDLRKKAFQIIHGFSVDESITGVRYAKQAVNVRSGPSTDYEKIGGLTFAQEVSVTGVADTGWYQIVLNGQNGYVSNKYLIDEKPKIQEVSNNLGYGTSPAQAENSMPDSILDTGESTSSDFYAVYSEAEMNAALEKGDLTTYFQMLNANSSATMAGGTNGNNSSANNGGEVLTTPDKSTALSTDFIDHLNSKREEAGLSVLTWSDSMGSTALERAEEVINDFSHNGVRNCSAENIGKFTSNSVSSWYDEFYNSSTHKLNMMDPTYKTAAAAVCEVGTNFYVVVLLGL